MAALRTNFAYGPQVISPNNPAAKQQRKQPPIRREELNPRLKKWLQNGHNEDPSIEIAGGCVPQVAATKGYKIRAGNRVRTDDLLITNQLLCLFRGYASARP